MSSTSSAPKKHLNVCITGAAGQITYSLNFAVCRGQAFGPDTTVELRLLDIPYAEKMLHGVTMELEDCAFPLITKIIPTVDLKTAFENVDYVIAVGAFPRREGMVRADLLAKNAGIFKSQGEALDKWASKDCKVLVVGNPANTNAMIAMIHAPSIPPANFTALTFLDFNRSRGFISRKLGVNATDVKNIAIWGNHSKTMVPDIDHAIVVGKNGIITPVRSAIADTTWIEETFVASVQQRGAEIIKARKFSSAASAANAICDHCRALHLGTPEGEFVSMGIASTGLYDVEPGLIFSMPVQCLGGGKYKVVEGVKISAANAKRFAVTLDELRTEKKIALEMLNNSK